MPGGIHYVASIHAIGEYASLAKDLRDIIGLFDVAERTGAKSCVERVLVAIHALGGGRNYYGRGACQRCARDCCRGLLFANHHGCGQTSA